MKQKYKIVRFYVLAVLLSLVGCEKEDVGPPFTNHVLLAYFGGDNNLSGEASDKISAIVAGWDTNSNNKLLIYVDTETGAPLLQEVVNVDGKNTTKTISTFTEENSADSKTLTRVLGQAKTMYSSSSFGLLVFSHASGWLPEGMLAAPKSIIIDQKKEMELVDFAEAIPDGTFEYIVFEACFMAGIEVAYQLRYKTDYILASSAEIVSPGFTNIYTSSVNELTKGTDGLLRFANTAFNYFDNQTGLMRSATFSLIKTSKLDELADFIKTDASVDQETSLTGVQHFDRYGVALFYDFGDYYYQVLTDENSKSRFESVMNKVVVFKGATPEFLLKEGGFRINKHSGLTLYPLQDRYPLLNERYKALDWYQVIKKNQVQY